MRYFMANQLDLDIGLVELEGPFNTSGAAYGRAGQIIESRLPRPMLLSDDKKLQFLEKEPPLPLILLDVGSRLSEEKLRLALLTDPMLRAVYELGRQEGDLDCRSRHRDSESLGG